MSRSSLLLALALVAVPLAACKGEKTDHAQVGPAADPVKSSGKGELDAIDVKTSKVEFVGSKVTGSHLGKFKTFSGKIELVDGKPEASNVSIDIDLASVETDEAKLTGHLKSGDFFEVEKFPKGSFVSTKIEAKSGPNGATHEVTGNLELHGVKKSITFPAKIDVDSDAVHASATFSIDRTQWGILYKGMADNLIKNDVVIKLDVRAPRNKS
ncbi:MAG: YceI family protein [Polyangiales bacterium]